MFLLLSGFGILINENGDVDRIKTKILRQNCYISESEPENRVGIKFLIAG
jgi:hypothetical protein